MTDASPDHTPDAPEPRYTRRLSTQVLIAFHQACDQGDFIVARQLLDVLEFKLGRTPNPSAGVNRHARETLVAAHERLWPLRYGAAEC
jgi:hypothetical protein